MHIILLLPNFEHGVIITGDHYQNGFPAGLVHMNNGIIWLGNSQVYFFTFKNEKARSLEMTLTAREQARV